MWRYLVMVRYILVEFTSKRRSGKGGGREEEHSKPARTDESHGIFETTQGRLNQWSRRSCTGRCPKVSRQKQNCGMSMFPALIAGVLRRMDSSSSPSASFAVG